VTSHFQHAPIPLPPRTSQVRPHRPTVVGVSSTSSVTLSAPSLQPEAVRGSRKWLHFIPSHGPGRSPGHESANSFTVAPFFQVCSSFTVSPYPSVKSPYLRRSSSSLKVFPCTYNKLTSLFSNHFAGTCGVVSRSPILTTLVPSLSVSVPHCLQTHR
jgi:hypothetical protein